MSISGHVYSIYFLSGLQDAPNNGMNPTRSASASRAGYADRWAGYAKQELTHPY